MTSDQAIEPAPARRGGSAEPGVHPVELLPTRRPLARRLKVGLVTTPFASMARPSIQVGLLVGYARRAGHEAVGLHLNLDLAARMDVDLYSELCEQRGDVFLGEWLFSAAAFGSAAPEVSPALLDHLSKIGEARNDERFAATLLELRDVIVPAYLDDLVAGIDWASFDVVGFSSTFQQNNASFALARRLKEHAPQVVTLFGGANFEGEMGRSYVRSVPAIDAVITGEADDAFPAFLNAVAAGADVARIPGVLVCRNGEVVGTKPAGLFEDLDSQPELDYDDYFERSERLGLLPPLGRRLVDIPFESARGCWWGAKRHCTFCGLNGGTMAYRAKSPARVVGELAGLVRRYRSFKLEAVDNIVDSSYLKTLFPALEALGTDLELFYEVKADLSRRDLERLSRAGVRRIQPGIESLSSHVLGLMRKGTRAAWNVNVLRWSRYYDIAVSWNLLYGFPHETEADYHEQAELLPQLVHLEPPTGPGRIWMERFSPLFTDRATFPAVRLEPAAGYRDVYPASFDLESCAYFFDYELADTLDQEVYAGCHKAIADWQAAWRSADRPQLTVWRMPGFIQIDDHRSPDRAGTFTFEGPMADLYLSVLEAPLRPSEIVGRLGWTTSEDRVTGLLDELCDAGLVMRDRNLYLALALPAGKGA